MAGLLPSHTIGGKAERWLFGDESTPGALGTGQYNPKGYQVDRGASDIYGYQDSRNQMAQGARDAAGRTGPQIATGPQDQFRQGQLGLMSQLQDQAAGRGPSLAQMQLQQASERNMANSLALGATQAGGMRGTGALRAILGQQGAIGQQLAADSAMMRLQEQQQAQGMLGGLMSGARGQDLGLATSQAGMDLQSRSLNDQMVQSYLKMGLDLDQDQMRAKMDLERLMADQDLQLEQLRMQGYFRRADDNKQIMKNLQDMATSAATGMPTGGLAGGGAPAGSVPDLKAAGAM